MVHIEATIEINAAPEQVREVFLDFPRLPEWTGFFKSIEVVGPKQPMQLGKGDMVRVDFGGMTMNAPIVENSPRLFKWSGGWKFIFLGDHSFNFEPSKINPGWTTFNNFENFSGALSFTMSMSPGKRTEVGFNNFCQDLKRRLESLENAKGAVASAP